MIRIRRPAAVPAVLAGEGERAKRKLCERFAAGERQFHFRSEIYGHAEVKGALKAAQFLKCCFCERTVGEDGHIEHFRPKAAVRATASASLSDTGYYWLAYEWKNLLLCCADCNVRHKANLFPLAEEDKRALSHGDSLGEEQPLFIDPADESSDPEELIEWRDNIACARSGDARARTTLEALNLSGPKRDGLLEARRQHLEILKQVVDVAVFFRAYDPQSNEVQALWQRAEAKLREAVSPAGTFSAMIRALLKQRGIAL